VYTITKKERKKERLFNLCFSKSIKAFFIFNYFNTDLFIFWNLLKVICKVKKTQHQNPEFGHTQGEIFKNLQKSTLAFKGG
jgi:hypothetical protein